MKVTVGKSIYICDTCKYHNWEKGTLCNFRFCKFHWYRMYVLPIKCEYYIDINSNKNEDYFREIYMMCVAKPLYYSINFLKYLYLSVKTFINDEYRYFYQ